MTRRLAIAAIATLLVGSACSLGVLADDASGGIEVSTPDRVDWRRNVAGIEVLGVDTNPDPGLLDVLGQALEEIPSELMSIADVRTVYWIQSDPDALEAEALAFARGPDIYLTNQTFELTGSRFELVEVLSHELAHVAQFRALTKEDIAIINGGGPTDFGATKLVASFALAVGWQNLGTDEEPRWDLPNPAGATTYGTTSPSEDMADAVARAAVGRGNELSRSRREWVNSWLGSTTRGLAQGMPYIPAPATAVQPVQPLYDEAAVATLGARGVDAASYVLRRSSPHGDRLAAEIESELGSRGYAGRLLPDGDEGVERYAGNFVRGDGLVIRVELWDFRNAPGFSSAPEEPVLTYVTPY